MLTSTEGTGRELQGQTQGAAQLVWPCRANSPAPHLQSVTSEGISKAKPNLPRKHQNSKAIKKLQAFSYGSVGWQLAWKENEALVLKNAGGSVKSH